MASTIDATKPVAVNPTTQSVRDNFLAAKNEIEALQAGVTKSRIYTVAGWVPTYLVEGTTFWVPETNIQLLGVFFYIGVPSASSVCTANVKKNGNTILSAPVESLATAFKSNTATPVVTTAGPNDYIHVDVQCPGGGAKNMTVHILYKSVA